MRHADLLLLKKMDNPLEVGELYAEYADVPDFTENYILKLFQNPFSIRVIRVSP
jgi:hypothetical protein